MPTVLLKRTLVKSVALFLYVLGGWDHLNERLHTT